MSEVIVKFDQLCKGYGSKEVLKSVNAEIYSGQVIGLLGLNGSGKTTLLETALGFAQPDSGAAYLFGKNSFDGLDEATKQRIGFVPQSDELLQNISCQRYLDLIAEFYPSWNKSLIDRLCSEWDIPLKQKTQALSVGQKQKMAILTALGHEPDLLVLDEPVASLDPLARRQFLTELVEIASDLKRTIIFSTHIVGDLERVATHVWLFKDGNIEIREELDTLKEKTVKITLPPDMEIPANFKENSLILCRKEQNTNILIFTGWTEQQHVELEKATGTKLAPEHLSLEEIFLEVHQ